MSTPTSSVAVRDSLGSSSQAPFQYSKVHKHLVPTWPALPAHKPQPIPLSAL